MQRLYPLEMPTQDKQAETTPEHSSNPPTEPDEPSQEAEHPPGGVSSQVDEVLPPSTSHPCGVVTSEPRAQILGLTLDEDENFS